MKVFRLACSLGHDFEGWFSSSADFDSQHSGGEIRCPLCESRAVTRIPSAPYVNTGARGTEVRPAMAKPEAATPGHAAAVAALKAYVLANTDDVGRLFPEVARRMHYGEEAQRGIRGRVSVAEAVELRDEGIEAVALPSGLALDEKIH